LIGHGPLPFHNIERSHKCRRDFSTLSKLDRNLMWFHQREDSIANLVTTVNTVCIGKTLMLIPNFIDPLSYCLHLIFHFLDLFCSDGDPILNMIPTQRCLMRSPIKKLERHHLNGSLITIAMKMSTLSQSVDYYKNRVMFPCCRQQSNNEIHQNDLPF
jgi:hypothetical protein